jgi:hypothetical protein
VPLGTSSNKEGAVVVVGTGKKETTGITNENDVKSRNLQKKGNGIIR